MDSQRCKRKNSVLVDEGESCRKRRKAATCGEPESDVDSGTESEIEVEVECYSSVSESSESDLDLDSSASTEVSPKPVSASDCALYREKKCEGLDETVRLREEHKVDKTCKTLLEPVDLSWLPTRRNPYNNAESVSALEKVGGCIDKDEQHQKYHAVLDCLKKDITDNYDDDDYSDDLLKAIVEKFPRKLKDIRMKITKLEYSQPLDFLDDLWGLIIDLDLNMAEEAKITTSRSFVQKFQENLLRRESEFCEELQLCCMQPRLSVPFLKCWNCDIVIREGGIYFTKEKFLVCRECYRKSRGKITLYCDENSSIMKSDTTNKIVLNKAEFNLKRNIARLEPRITCDTCKKSFHRMCVNVYRIVLVRPSTANFGIVCKYCTQKMKKSTTTQPDACFELFTKAEELTRSDLSDYIEDRVAKFLPPNSSKVIVRVVSSIPKMMTLSEKLQCFLKPYDVPGCFPYMSKVIFCFQMTKEGAYVLFFAMYVQEYDNECPLPNRNSIYVELLDSAKLFEPALHRTEVFYSVMMNYLDFMRKLGFINVFLWSCPPIRGVEYVFHHRPAVQLNKACMSKDTSAKRLNAWYERLMDFCMRLEIITKAGKLYDWCPKDVNNFFRQFPYFEEDHWPKVMEEVINSVQVTGGLENKKSKSKKASVRTHNKVQTCATAEVNAEAVFLEVTKRLKNFQARNCFYYMTLTTTARNDIVRTDFMLASPLIGNRDVLVSFFKEYNLEFTDIRKAAFSTAVLLAAKRMEVSCLYCASCNTPLADGFMCRSCSSATCSDQKCQHEYSRTYFWTNSIHDRLRASLPYDWKSLKVNFCSLLEKTCKCDSKDDKTTTAVTLPSKTLQGLTEHSKNCRVSSCTKCMILLQCMGILGRGDYNIPSNEVVHNRNSMLRSSASCNEDSGNEAIPGSPERSESTSNLQTSLNYKIILSSDSDTTPDIKTPMKTLDTSLYSHKIKNLESMFAMCNVSGIDSGCRK